jgi:hypothetical protein
MIAPRVLDLSGRHHIELGVMQEISQMRGIEHKPLLDCGVESVDLGLWVADIEITLFVLH